MEIVKVRKARSSNLSAVERAILAELCSKYSWIVENKQTDSGSAKTKEAGWQQLAVEFVGAGGQPREWLQLKHVRNIYGVLPFRTNSMRYMSVPCYILFSE